MLQINNLSVHYQTGDEKVHVLQNLCLNVRKGERLGIVGESGCGKTTLAKVLLQQQSENAMITSGEIMFFGENLLTLNQENMRQKRGKEIALIPQNSMNALNPVHRIQDQLLEMLFEHTKTTKTIALEMIKEVIWAVGIHDRHLKDYPHQLSGGMKQRVIIAMALLLDPALIIADEPTTSLDVIVQRKILQQMKRKQEEMNSALLFISHDLALVLNYCHTIIVMYGGKIMETCSVDDFVKHASHPYSLGLQHASPSFSPDADSLITIPGAPPHLTELNKGCLFQERCPFADEKCKTSEPQLQQMKTGHQVACHYTNKAEQFRKDAKVRAFWEGRR